MTQTFNGNISGNAATVTNLTATSATEVGQGWTTPAFSSGNFTGGNAMTWTVAEADVTTFAYIITGKIMTISFYIGTTTVGGTPDAYLKLTIPASKTNTKTMMNFVYVSDNGTAGTGMCIALAGETFLRFYKNYAADNWSAATDTTGVRGQITIEIN